MIKKRLSELSSSEELFNSEVTEYDEALKLQDIQRNYNSTYILTNRITTNPITAEDLGKEK